MGAPKIYFQERKVLNVRVDKTTYRLIQNAAGAKDVSISKLLADFIDQNIEDVLR